ncbi:MAG: homoserine kinase [Erysipelotrichaceae bacterium]|nr:homoserine kinase [Erysipelotrichaceae bacterium]
MIKVRVPGTSANLGPGFDCFGIGYELYNTYSVELSDTLVIEGCDKRFCNEENLFYQAYLKGIKDLGIKDSIHVIFDTQVPVSRGLGSSASLIIGGLKAASALHGNQLSDERIMQLATQMEKHPDNLAPALYGGLIAAMFVGDEVCVMKKEVCKDYYFTLMIPDFEVATEAARKILPKSISLKKAALNVAHACFLLEALQDGNDKVLKEASKDYFHEDYRAKLIADYEPLRQQVLDQGALTFMISGSGPCCVAISRDPKLDKKIKKTNLKANWVFKTCPVSYKGTIVEV